MTAGPTMEPPVAMDSTWEMGAAGMPAEVGGGNKPVNRGMSSGDTGTQDIGQGASALG